MRHWRCLIAVLAFALVNPTGFARAGSHLPTPGPDAPPRANAGLDRTVYVGKQIVFSGLKSTDSDGNIIKYDWDFGDGTRAIGLTPAHVFWRPGKYSVRLTVRDDSQLTANVHTDSAIVTVTRPANAKPVAHAAYRNKTPLRVGQPVLFDGSKSTDSDGNIIRYDWTFGTGATASGIAPVFTYQRAGRYQVTLTVRDDHGDNTGRHSTEIIVMVDARANTPGGK